MSDTQRLTKDQLSYGGRSWRKKKSAKYGYIYVSSYPRKKKS